MGIERREVLLLTRLCTAGVALVTAAACSSSGQPPAPATCGAGTLVAGVQAQSGLMGALQAVRVTTTREGAPPTYALYKVGEPAPLLPHEQRAESAIGEQGARVQFRVDAFTVPTIEAEPKEGEPTPLVTRIADAPFACGETKLVRMRLETTCVNLPGASAPQCAPPQTCQSGRCIDPTLIPDDLEPYAPGWDTETSDQCKPAHAGPPELVIGTGQTDYHVLPTDPIKPEKGPQGGHHLWIAVRMKNLKQSGTTTTITGVQPDTGFAIPVTSFVFTFDPDEGGYCKLYGLRYQLDNGAHPVGDFLGKPLDVTVELRDATGLTAKQTVRVNVASEVIVPAGL